ncbi:MAG: VWA domain-containing protein, partial [Nocardioidaceae bacterium]
MALRRCLVLVAGVLTATVAIGGLTAPPTALADDDTEGAAKMILVLDSSGSMKEDAGGGQSKIAAAKSALRSVVDGLPEDAEVGLRVFG